MIGTPAARIRSRAAILEPIASIASGGGPIQREPGGLDRAGEVGVLREEPVPGMNRLRAGTHRGVEQAVDRAGSSPLPGRGRARYASSATATCSLSAVGLRVDRDRADAELAQGAEHTDGDLAAVGDEDLRERRHADAYSLGR